MKAIYEITVKQDLDWKDKETRIAAEKFTKTHYFLGIPFKTKDVIITHEGECLTEKGTALGFSRS